MTIVAANLVMTRWCSHSLHSSSISSLCVYISNFHSFRDHIPPCIATRSRQFHWFIALAPTLRFLGGGGGVYTPPADHPQCNNVYGISATHLQHVLPKPSTRSHSLLQLEVISVVISVARPRRYSSPKPSKFPTMRTRTLNNEERALIVRMRQNGVQCKTIAEHLVMPRSTVSTVLTKWRNSGCLETKIPTGRPLELSPRSQRDLGRLVNLDRKQTLNTLAQSFHLHRNTIRTYIRRLGFENRIARRKPYLNAIHQAKRFAFAKKYCRWTISDWKNVIWTDESTFELGKTSRQVRVWRKPHEAYEPHCLAPTFKSGRSSVMVWGAFTGYDKSPIVVMPPGERSARDFVRIVYEGTLSGFYFMHDHPQQLILMEDGAPVHRSNYPKDWREAHGIPKLDWPPNSPDLNPIENLWKTLKDLLHHHNRPKNKEEMIHLIQLVWDEVSMDRLQQLIATMPKRMKAVISAKGGSTRW